MDEPTTTSAAPSEDSLPPVRQLNRAQRRVFGVLVEKGFTTPEYYPLTLKAVTTGCNQKSNRDPVTNYTEDSVEETLDELRELGLVAVVHTESGRTERFRHFARKRYPFSEPQLAIMTELLLRGRQQLGELRSRASRMVAIDGLAELREHLQELSAGGYIHAGGPLERRGIEVDHALYTEGEQPVQPLSAPVTADHTAPTATTTTISTPTAGASSQVQELRADIDELKEQIARLTAELADLKRDLGV
jgi:uncharacterized protein YceH (UPF0502 family)